MSGIYGVYRHDGAPVDPRWLERMKEAMAYYGPDGGACQVDGPVGMGHLLLKINPEDAFDCQPVRGDRGLVVSTARLDNRDSLLEIFNVALSEAPRISDGQLVSLAFDRWGEELCTHIEGDWALAAWDPREHRLLLARDVFGKAALYYYQGEGFFAFASSLKALLALPGTVREADLQRLARVLVGWAHDAELTAYKGLRSVLGAHRMSVSAGGSIRSVRYWSYGKRDLLRYRRDDEYVEDFLEHYTRAIRSCLRTDGKIGSELSGGRDSGSVVTMAAPLLAAQGRDLRAFTSVTLFPPDGADKDRLGDEWDPAHATATMAGANVKHVPIDAKGYGVLQGAEHYLDVHDGPHHAVVNNYWVQALLEAASRSGIRALLSGGMGNSTVSWDGNGSALLALLQGNPSTALRLFFLGEANPWLTLKRQVLKPLLTPARRALRRRISSGIPWRAYSALNPRMARELDLDGQMRATGYDPSFTLSPLQDLRGYSRRFGLEIGTEPCIASELSAWHSLSAFLDPTANLSFYEFLLRIPDDQFVRKGESSMLFKRAFGSRMPQSVVYGKRKGLQAADVGHRILRELTEFQDCLNSIDALPEARAVLDVPLLRQCLDDLVTKVDPRSNMRAAMILMRGVSAGLFLCRLAKQNSRKT
jgi:asparagine synthase (glutamine-hydrolysing)